MKDNKINNFDVWVSELLDSEEIFARLEAGKKGAILAVEWIEEQMRERILKKDTDELINNFKSFLGVDKI